MKQLVKRLFGQLEKKAAIVTAAVLVQAEKSRNYKPTAFEQRMLTAGLMLGAVSQANAQGSAATALKSVQTTVISIVQVLFAIFLVIALIRTAKKFMSGEPDAMTSVGWLVGGVLLWFGFQYFKDDLVSNVGGGNTGGGVK